MAEATDRIAALREAFSAFLGKDRFRKFVDLSARKFNLKFWQEKAWTEFVQKNPEFNDRLDDLNLAIRICTLHGDGLVQDLKPSVGRKIGVMSRLLSGDPGRAAKHYPNAESGPHYFDDLNPGGSYEVWYCPTCRERETEWKAYLNEGKDRDD